MAFQLSFVGGPEKGRTAELTAGQTVVLGRGEDCDVQLADPRASRVHCKLQVSDDGVTWTDIYSTTAGAGGSQTLPVSGAGRYLRMYGTQRATQWGYSLWELQVFGR